MKYFLILISILFGIYLGINNPREVYQDTPVKDVSSISQPTSAPSPTPTPDTKEVIDEITEVWKDEKKSDIIRAINCGYGESGLRINAININTNGTRDHSVFQVNDVHTKRYGQEFKNDWRTNIRVAYQIFKNRGWDAWYARSCIE